MLCFVKARLTVFNIIILEDFMEKLSDHIVDHDQLYCIGIHLAIPYHVIRQHDVAQQNVR